MLISLAFFWAGKLINPIVVSCPNTSEFRDWIHYVKAADIPVLSPPPPVYDIIYTPTQREVSGLQTLRMLRVFCRKFAS